MFCLILLKLSNKENIIKLELRSDGQLLSLFKVALLPSLCCQPIATLLSQGDNFSQKRGRKLQCCGTRVLFYSERYSKRKQFACKEKNIFLYTLEFIRNKLFQFKHAEQCIPY